MPIPPVPSGRRHSSTDVVLLGRFELSGYSRTERIIGYLGVLELLYSNTHTHTHIHIYTGCNRRNGPDFGRVFLMLNYTEKPQNTYIQS